MSSLAEKEGVMPWNEINKLRDTAATLSARLGQIEVKLDLLIGLTRIVGGVIISCVVVAIMGLIIKGGV